MSRPRLSREDALQACLAMGHYGSTTNAARALGISPQTLEGRLRSAALYYRLRPKKRETGAEKEVLPAEAEAPAAPPDPLEVRREAMASTALRARVKGLQSDLIAAQDTIAAMNALHEARVEPARWLTAPHVAGELALTPMLFTSDYQCGEVVNADEIDGINQYNQHIFAERYQLMIDKTIMLAEQNTGATVFPEFVYLRGGDAISGSIHDELAETNDLAAVPACRAVFEQEREGIRRLRDKFGRVRVISLPGNHGRTTFKPRAKSHAELNFETLLSWWLATAFEGDDRVRFWTPKSTDALFDVAGYNVLLSHGDKMGARGGTGFIGPAANIAKGHFKLYQNWTKTGARVDLVLTGHLHTSLKLELGYGNGSLCGYGEYARDLRCTPAAAAQWLFFMHRETMVSHAFELQLSDRPRRRVVDESMAA